MDAIAAGGQQGRDREIGVGGAVGRAQLKARRGTALVGASQRPEPGAKTPVDMCGRKTVVDEPPIGVDGGVQQRRQRREVLEDSGGKSAGDI